MPVSSWITQCTTNTQQELEFLSLCTFRSYFVDLQVTAQLYIVDDSCCLVPMPVSSWIMQCTTNTQQELAFLLFTF